MRKVLFIAHFFPPIGGAGVQRPVKFVKHLSSFGLDPVVLTEEAQPGSRWKPEDLSLLADIRSETVVHRTVWSVPPPGSPPRTIREARYAAYLDAGAHLIQTHRPDVIFVTMSPFGDARIAAALAHQFRIPWVADLRDPWALDEVQIYRSRWHRRRERLLMQHSLASAASIILNTPEAATRFRQSFPQLAERARVSITNGYDVEDFRGPTPSNSPTQFTIIHSGYLHTDIGLHQCRNWWLYQCLGRIEKGIEILPRSHFYLMQALERWLQEDPTIHNTVRLVLIGVTSRADRELVHNSSARELVEFIGYQPHAECVRRIETADVLFLPMHHVPMNRRATIVPGKTYEYMASRRPIVAAVPEGDARDFLADCGTARLCYPKDVSGLLAALKASYQDWKEKADLAQRWNREAVERFERRQLTRLLADELTSVIHQATTAA